MNIWERLGIAPTTDIAEIKAAYAAKAKECHPEERPEEFQALQKAYKLAVQYAKKIKQAGQRPKETGTEPPLWDFRTNAPYPRPEPKQEEPERFRAEEEPLPERSGAEPEPPYSEQAESVSESRQPKPPRSEPEPEHSEHEFDYSEVDTYGDRERFFSQMLLIAKNPCIKNKITVWDVFLHQPSFDPLFQDNKFRENFVRTLCGLSGWQRETILYLEKFLKKYHRLGKLPAGGRWETDLRCFRMQKRFRIRFPLAAKGVYASKEAAEIQNRIMSVFHKQNRILDFDNPKDVRDYLTVYFSYGSSHEDQIEFLYRQAGNFHAAWVGAGIAVAAFLILCAGLHWSLVRSENAASVKAPSAGTQEERQEIEEDYIRWLNQNRRELRLQSDEEKEEEVEERVDDVLRRYEEWTEKQISEH